MARPRSRALRQEEELVTATLARLAEIATELGDTDVAAQARALDDRVAEGRFYVACLGQFKRGKSTLLNALVGVDVLPVGVVPVTAVVTAVRYGATLRARVRLGDGDWREVPPDALDEYVAEAKNPENVKDVRGVEVFAPSPLLRSGMCLVDTPGVGSVFSANTAATVDFVPHIDAAIFVIGADPPLARSELDLVTELAHTVDRIIFVVAKADRLRASELAEGTAFAETILTQQLGRPTGPFLEVSAHERVDSGAATRDWATLEASLLALGGEGRVAFVRDAATRGAARLGKMLAREIDEQRAALVRPQDESRLRVAQLGTAIGDAEQSLIEMAYLFASVQDQLSKRFEKDRKTFLQEQEPAALDELDLLIRADAKSDTSALSHRAMDHARAVGLARVEAWRAKGGPAAERLYEEAGRRFLDLGTEFLHRLAASGDEALVGLPSTFDAETRFRTKPKFYFTDRMTLGTPSLIGRIVGLFTSKAQRLAAIEYEAGRYLRRLFEANSNRSASDFAEQVRLSRRRLEADLRSHLVGVVTSAARALERATTTIAAGSEAVDRELARLERLRTDL